MRWDPDIVEAELTNRKIALRELGLLVRASAADTDGRISMIESVGHPGLHFTP